MLKKEGISVNVLNASCPLHSDFESVKELLKKPVLTFEDHNVNNGLGALLAEYFVAAGFLPDSFERFGVKDYSLSGTAEVLYKISGISSEEICKKVRALNN